MLDFFFDAVFKAYECIKGHTEWEGTLVILGLCWVLNYVVFGGLRTLFPPAQSTPCFGADVKDEAKAKKSSAGKADDEKNTSKNLSGPSVIPCHNPATGESLGEVRVNTPAEVVKCVHRARIAQRSWATTSFKERNRVLRSLLDEVLANQDEIVKFAAIDSGKPKLDAVFGEIITVCEKLRWTIANGERYLRPESRGSGIMMHKRGHVEYLPMGVFGVIVPWNYPFQNIFGSIIAPLYAGNGCVVKPSELTSFSTKYFESIIHRVLAKHGHSKDLVQFVAGYGETGAALVNSGVDKVIFIGSPINGKRVMETASKTLTPVVLELGGKDPMILCDDCDFEQVVPIALRGVFQHCGQNCVGVERIYCYDKIYDKFMDRVVTATKNLRQGVPMDGGIDCGAMVMPRQLEIVQELVDDAVKKGAKLCCGGRKNPNLPNGQFYEPTILTNVNTSMRIANEEVFGPVMLVFKVKNDEEAIAAANSAGYGLASSVFSRNTKRAQKIASQIRAGTTTINDWAVGYLLQDIPFGGVGVSGFGKFNGPEGLRDCCLVKSYVNERFGLRNYLPGGLQYPVSDKAAPVMQAGLRIIYGNGFTGRAIALWDMVMMMCGLLKSGKSASLSHSSPKTKKH